jgi:hypothetical protein
MVSGAHLVESEFTARTSGLQIKVTSVLQPQPSLIFSTCRWPIVPVLLCKPLSFQLPVLKLCSKQCRFADIIGTPEFWRSFVEYTVPLG